MGRCTRWIAAAVLVLTGIPLAGCVSAPAAGSAAEQKIATVEPIPGASVSRVMLSADAAHRIGLTTDVVREAVVAGLTRKVVPYSAVLYDATGKAYAYASPQPLVYLRVPLEIDYIEGDLAVLNDGPPVGTAVVTVGAPELLGTEFELGGE
jgi:hypothetical protein